MQLSASTTSEPDRIPLATGDPAVDDFLGGGFFDGLYQLVGLPGVGKSALLRGLVERNFMEVPGSNL